MDWQSYAENSIKRIYDEVLGKGTDFQQAIQLHSPVPPPPLPTKRSSYGTAAKKHSSSFLVAHGPSATGIASNRQKEEEAKQFTQEVEARLEELTARRKKEIENVC
mmetsp:Transcript_11502/g.22372  ORF Transcript_11502/g.22372 Transcript_11502/m.22372 type:complete len:106 (-) Transcript_11502:75-392(-)